MTIILIVLGLIWIFIGIVMIFISSETDVFSDVFRQANLLQKIFLVIVGGPIFWMVIGFYYLINGIIYGIISFYRYLGSIGQESIKSNNESSHRRRRRVG